MDEMILRALDKNGKQQLDSVITILQGEIDAIAVTLSLDPALRLQYSRLIKQMSEDYQSRASVGLISWEQAAREANQARNTIMDLIRGRSTPLGKALAEEMKRVGKTFNELVAKKAIEIFGEHVDFNMLTDAQKNHVYSKIVESAGKSNGVVNLRMKRLSRAGKALIILSLAISIYEIYNAEDWVYEVERQTAITGAAVAGGWAAGALAGLICGPGAPVCVVIGGFVGAVMAAWGMGEILS